MVASIAGATSASVCTLADVAFNLPAHIIRFWAKALQVTFYAPLFFGLIIQLFNVCTAFYHWRIIHRNCRHRRTLACWLFQLQLICFFIRLFPFPLTAQRLLEWRMIGSLSHDLFLEFYLPIMYALIVLALLNLMISSSGFCCVRPLTCGSSDLVPSQLQRAAHRRI
jgi:hypothetical protein